MSIGQSAESDTTHKIYYCLCEVLQSEITQNWIHLEAQQKCTLYYMIYMNYMILDWIVVIIYLLICFILQHTMFLCNMDNQIKGHRL